jgi:hypothetical protein
MARKGNPLFLFFILPFVVIGLVFAGIGGAAGWSSCQTLLGARRVEGTVAELVRVKSLKGAVGPKGHGVSNRPAFAPAVEYRVEGKSYRIQGHISSSNPAYAVGEKVAVLYPPGHPAEGTIDSFSEKWLGPLFFGVIGLLFAAIGLGMLWYRRRSA